jgi:cell division protein FtsI/penicillin-binding protein 2
VVGICALLALLPACDQSSSFSLPPARDAATEFIDAWEARDFESMRGLLTRDSRARYPARRLEQVMHGAFAPGRITGFEVEVAGAVMEPGISSEEELRDAERVTAQAPYSISYRSPAARAPARLSGTLPLRYDKDSQRWMVGWSKAALWPGISGADHFEMEIRWLRRGPITDSSGRVLARGRAGNRSYPQGSLAGTTVGHIGKLGRHDLEGRPFYYGAGDLAGASGLEQSYEGRLAGVPATRLLVVGRRGRALETLGRKEGRPGRKLTTTLDIDVQRAAETAYGPTVGGAVVVEPDSGNVLAVVSSSSFDPNNYVGATEVEPFNRALSGLYPPGSAMKVVTASAALDSGEYSPSSTVTGPKDYKGVVNFESGEYGSIPLRDALRFSVNTAFAQVAEDLGPKRMSKYAHSFGFNLQPHLGVGAARSSFPRPQHLWDLMWGSIGQAEVLATPMEMSTVAATIANHGKRMQPRLSFLLEKRGTRVVSQRTAAQMNDMMQGVVSSGTGVAAQVPGVSVAGKTGTAEVDVAGERRNHAWFVAFAPATAPRVAIGLVSEYGGVGGKVAAPLAARMLAGVLPLVR